MKKKIKLLPIIFTIFLTINITENNLSYFNILKGFLLNESTNNIVLLEAGNSSASSDSENSIQNQVTEDSSNQSTDANASTTGNSSESNSSSSTEIPPVNTSENNSSKTDQVNAPSSSISSQPLPVQEPSSTLPISKSVENNVAPSQKTTNSIRGNSGSSYSKSKVKNSTSTSSSIFNIENKDSNKQDQVESKPTSNSEVQPMVNANNNQINNEEQNNNSTLLLIKSSLNKGNINLNDKSNGIKLVCDNPSLKEIYYLFSQKKDIKHDGNWIKYSSPLKFDKSGTWYIQYKAVDKAGKESYGSFGPYKVSYEYKALGTNMSDNSFKRKIIGFSMILIIIILAVIYIVKTNRSPYSRLEENSDSKRKRRFHLG